MEPRGAESTQDWSVLNLTYAGAHWHPYRTWCIYGIADDSIVLIHLTTLFDF